MKWLRFWTIQALVLILMIAALEGVLRLAGYPYQRHSMAHPVLHHALRPGAMDRLVGEEYSRIYQINSSGMRDPERSAHKPEGLRRVMLLGDSFTEGFGVSQDRTIAAVAEKILHAKKPGSFEVMNAGCASYSPLLENLFYRTVGRVFKPDRVFLFLDWSDIQDDFVYEQSAVRDKEGRITAVLPVGVTSPPTDRSAILNYARLNRSLVSLKRIFVGDFIRRCLGPERYKEFKKRLYPNLNLHVTVGDLRSDRYMILRDEYFEALMPRIRRTQEHILELAEAVRADGARLTLVLYPIGVQVSGEAWPEGRAYFGFEKNRVYGDQKPFGEFKRFAAENDIPVFDLLPLFRETPASVRMFYDEDGHFTEDATARVGVALADYALLTEAV